MSNMAACYYYYLYTGRRKLNGHPVMFGAIITPFFNVRCTFSTVRLLYLNSNLRCSITCSNSIPAQNLRTLKKISESVYGTLLSDRIVPFHRVDLSIGITLSHNQHSPFLPSQRTHVVLPSNLVEWVRPVGQGQEADSTSY